MIRRLIVAATVLAAGVAGAAERTPSNFERCRDQIDGCNVEALTDGERKAVEAFALGRNFRNCIDDKPPCDLSKLTWDQAETLVAVHQERVAMHAAKVEAAKASARNLSACVYSEPSCDMSSLTLEQLATMRDAVEQHATFKTIEAERSTKRAALPTVPELQMPQKAPEPSRGQRFMSGLLDFLGDAATAYVEFEAARIAAANEAPIIVSGGSTVVVPSGSGYVAASGSVIESRIDGAFEGWTGDTIFKLQNGQIWRQVTYNYKYKYIYAPKVTIFRSGSVYRMAVDGMDDSIQVRQLR